jgi:hypothetical protein
MILRSVSRCLILFTCALCFLATFAFAETLQSRPHRSSPAVHTRTLKRTWRTGPASTPPDTEVLPSHPASIPPALRGTTLSAEQERKAGEAQGARPEAGSDLAAKRLPAVAEKTASTRTATPISLYVDQEKRARDEMNCLSTNALARQAFYDELRRTVDQARAGQTEMNEKNSAPCSQ